MAGLDELISQIPVADIAGKIGANQSEVADAVKQLVPALVGGLQVNAANDTDTAGKIAGAAEKHAASGLLDGGVSVGDVDENDGDKIVANIFGGNNSDSVASALAGADAGGANGDLIKKLLPILAPIVLAYIGKQFGNQGGAPAGGQPRAGGGLGDVLGSILGGAGGGGGNNNPLGSILGSVLGGGGGNNAIGDILGGLLGGKK
ncbi:MAG: DUF937 domain-containing protein [Mycobacterium sp.]|nr:DUF937 domain-containing protein [Mycobacterium sp.]